MSGLKVVSRHEVNCSTFSLSPCLPKDARMNPFPVPAMFPFAHAPWSYFKLPVSIETLLETHRKNAAAWTNASDVAFEAPSTLAGRQRNLLKTTTKKYGKIARDVMAS